MAALRPGERALKTAACCLSGGGLVAALVAPSPAYSGMELTRSAVPGQPAAVSVREAATPVVRDSYGVIGFTAVAKPKPKRKPKPEPAPATAESRTQARATRSDSYARQGLSYENGMSPNAVAVANAVRAEFGDLTMGGYRAGDPGDHGSGNAVDVMCSSAQGDAIADYLMSRAGELNIKYLIWEQRRWAPGGSWEMMEDRGSATANHYDHVHVSVY